MELKKIKSTKTKQKLTGTGLSGPLMKEDKLLKAKVKVHAVHCHR